MMEIRIHGRGGQGAVTSSKLAGLAREVVEGRFKLNMKPRKLKPLKEFFKLQGRFRHLTDEQIAEYESRVHDRWQKLLVRHERGY